MVEATVQNDTEVRAIKVYARDGKYGRMYSGTDSNGELVNFKFDSDLEVPDLKAFEIYDAIGTQKRKTIELDGADVEVRVLYISGCKFRKIVGEALPL